MAPDIHALVRHLDDLELAVLVSLVAQQHCLLSTGPHARKGLQEELHYICSGTFGLNPVVVECSPEMTVEQFSNGLLVTSSPHLDATTLQEDLYNRPLLAFPLASVRADDDTSRHASITTLDERRIANVIILTDLDLANASVQVQALELIRTKRIFTRTAMHSASKDLMVLAIVSRPEGRLSHHLNDFFGMSHHHDDENHELDLRSERTPSVLVSSQHIQDLRKLASNAHHTPEIAAYLHNIVVFLRNSRFISGGVTATATRQLRIMAKVLAPLHGMDYVTPSLVALAVRKVYPHRLVLATPETEASLQWGSDREAVREMLEGITVEDAIEDVLATVDSPL